MKNFKNIPQSPDVEEVVLGILLQFQNSLDEVINHLSLEVFYTKRHKIIFKAIRSLFNKNEAIDIITVSNELKSMGNLESVGGDKVLIELTQKISSSAHIDFYTRIILQKYIQRELIKSSEIIIKKSFDESADSIQLLNEAYSNLNKLSELIISNKSIDLKEVTIEVVEKGGMLFRNEILPGVKTPIRSLTEKIGGWKRGQLIIIAARPGMGKTAFALKSAWEAANNNVPVGFFSLEMPARELVSRLWSMGCRIDNDKFDTKGLSPEEQKMILTHLHSKVSFPLHIEEGTSLTIEKILVKAKKLKKEKGIKLMVVDYLQLMNGNEKTREQEISKISRGLKTIAIELQIPVIALSQLSRAVENRAGSKRPMLSDLRESGAIEQDADVVQFIYRPEYYGLSNWDDYDQESCIGQAEYIIAKNRNGRLVRNRMKFESKFTNFTDLDD